MSNTERPPLRFFTHIINASYHQSHRIQRTWGKAEMLSRREEGNELYRFYDLVNLRDGSLDGIRSALAIQWQTEDAQAHHHRSNGHKMYSSTKEDFLRTDYAGVRTNIRDAALKDNDLLLLQYETQDLSLALGAFRYSLFRTINREEHSLYQASAEDGSHPPYSKASLLVLNTVSTLRDWLNNFSVVPGTLQAAHHMQKKE